MRVTLSGRLEASDFDRKSPWGVAEPFPEFVDNHLPQACQIPALQAFIQERKLYTFCSWV